MRNLIQRLLGLADTARAAVLPPGGGVLTIPGAPPVPHVAPPAPPPVATPPAAPTPPVAPTTPVVATAPVAPVAPKPARVGPTVAIVNAGSTLKDDEFAPVIAALQTQVDRDFAPIWETACRLVFYPQSQITVIPKDNWVILVMDTSDQAGALGYHDLTESGMPVGKVFAHDDIKYGLSWTVTLSHELLEMLVDPYITNTVFVQSSDTAGTLYAYEVADACEDDQFGYTIDGVLVSDFVTPAWFESFRAPGSTKFDFQGLIKQPLQLLSGGYIGAFEVGPNSRGWTQITAQATPGPRLLHKGPTSRKDRRGHRPVA